jgi:outer membrane immunogenic protein
MINRLVFSLIGLCAFSSANSGFAQQLSSVATAVKSPDTNNSHYGSGFYAGASIGFTSSNLNTNYQASGPGAWAPPASYWASSSLAAINNSALSNPNYQAVSGSVFAGYNVAWKSLVLSPEAYLDFGNRSFSSNTGGITYPCCGGSVNVGQVINSSFGSNFRLRAGVPVKAFLPYIFGGLSWRNINIQNSFGDTYGHNASQNIMTGTWGYILGGGLEYALTRRVSLRAEYGYDAYTLPQQSISSSNATSDSVVFGNYLSAGSGTLGVVYKF